MQDEIIEMPKTQREQLNEIEIGKSKPITEESRKSWATFLIRFHKSSKKRFTIRTTPGINEIKIWRLPDFTEEATE